MALGLASTLPTFYKAIEGLSGNEENTTDLWKGMNSVQGFLSKFTQNSMSDEAQQSMYNYEQLGGLVSDVFAQIYEQRAAASLSKLFYKVNDEKYMSSLVEKTTKALEKGAYEGLINKGNVDDIAEMAFNKSAELSLKNSARSKLASNLSLGYMALTQSSEVYGDALSGGYDRRSAGLAALLAATGQFALMSNNEMGKWFLDKTTGFSEGTSKAAQRKAINDLLPNIKKTLDVFEVDKKEGKRQLGNLFKSGFSKFKNILTEPSELGENLMKNAIVEGVEETTEEAAIDMAKGVVDVLSYMGMTSKQGSFGGLDNVFSKEGLARYVNSIVGGAIGGGLFEMQHKLNTIIDPKNNPVNKSTNNELIRLIANGQTKELLNIIDADKSKYGSELSPVVTKVDGKDLYLSGENLSQADIIANTMKQHILHLDNQLNLENLKDDDESLIRKAIQDEIMIKKLKETGTDSFILSDFNEYVTDLLDVKNKIEKEEGNPAELKIIRDKIDNVLSGKMSEYYFGLSKFTLNDKLSKPFANLNVKDYVERKYNKEYDASSESEKKVYDKEFEKLWEGGDFKNKVKTQYSAFQELISQCSPSLVDYDKDGYLKVKEQAYKKLRLDTIQDLTDIFSVASGLEYLKGINSFTEGKVKLGGSVKINLADMLIDKLGIIKETSDETRISLNSLGLNANITFEKLEEMINTFNQQEDVEPIEFTDSFYQGRAKPTEEEVLSDFKLFTGRDFKDDEASNFAAIESNIPDVDNAYYNEVYQELSDYAEAHDGVIPDQEMKRIITERKQVTPFKQWDSATMTPETHEKMVVKNLLTPKLNMILDYGENVEILDSSFVDDILEVRNELVQSVTTKLQNYGINDIANYKSILGVQDSQDTRAIVEEAAKLERIDEILKKPRKINTLLEKLSEYQVKLFGGNSNLTIFNILKNNTDEFNKADSPGNFLRSEIEIGQLKKAIDTVAAISAVANAMLTTKYDSGEIVGFNSLLNKWSQKNEIGKVFEEINQESFASISDDLALIDKKLRYYKALAEKNAGSEFEVQEKIKVATIDAVLKTMLSDGDLDIRKLKIGDKSLFSSDDLQKIDTLTGRAKLIEIENILFDNFEKTEGELEEKLKSVFSPFLNSDDNKKKLDTGLNSNLTSEIKTLEFKDYYFYLFSVLAGKSQDFHIEYEKLLENELTLETNKAPFFAQTFVLRQIYG